MATTVKFRTVATATSTAGTAKSLVIPATWVVGDYAIAHVTLQGAPDATPSGWTLRASSQIASQLWSGIYVKRLVAGDLGATFTVNIAAAGKATILMAAAYASLGQVIVLGAVAQNETASSSTHAQAAIVTGGPGAVVDLLALKDTSTAVSGTYTPPTNTGSQVTTATGGGSQQINSMVVNNGGDVAASSSYGSGLSWSIFAADGTTAVTSANAITWQLFLAAVLRPVADGSVAAGATFVGGTTITGTTGDDDPTTYEQYGGTSVTNSAQLAVSTTIPSVIALDVGTDVAATSSSVHAYLDLGDIRSTGSNLLDLGTYSTLIPTDASGGTTIYFPISGLTGAQQSSILADAQSGTPKGLWVRWVTSIA